MILTFKENRAPNAADRAARAGIVMPRIQRLFMDKPR